MDAVPGEAESLLRERLDGLRRHPQPHQALVDPGDPGGVRRRRPELRQPSSRRAQTPWSVAGPAVAAIVACSTDRRPRPRRRRARTLIARWRDHLVAGLTERGIEHVPSRAPFVLARLGAERLALRDAGVAVRRADTFPGLDSTWARIAVRPEAMTDRLFAALDRRTR